MQMPKYTKEPGYIYDLLFILVLYYNKDLWVKRFVNTDKGQADIEFYTEILNKFPPFPEELKPFFYLKDGSVCLLSMRYFQKNLPMFFNGHGVEILYKDISDADKMKTNIAKFFINSDINSDNIKNYSDLELIKTLFKNNLPEDIKRTIVLTLMDTQTYCDKLIEVLMSIEKMLSEYYRENYDLIPALCETVTPEMIEASFRNGQGSEYSLNGRELVVSACIIHINVFRFSFLNIDNESKTGVIIGINGQSYMECMGSLMNFIDVSLYGKILSDANRIKVLEMLSSKGELFTGEIAQALGAALPSTYYHLEMMVGAKMLKSRSEGRAVYYSINYDYFTDAAAEIKKLIK